jgi:hypothetical protein
LQHRMVAAMTMTVLVLAAALPGFAQTPTLADEGKGRVFELRTYVAVPGKLDALNARFRDHTLALFKKHGMEVVGFWTPTNKETGADTLVYVLAHKSRAAADESWKAFRADPVWISAKQASEAKANGPLTSKVESVYLAATDYSPLK